jgi:hypothetical protein
VPLKTSINTEVYQGTPSDRWGRLNRYGTRPYGVVGVWMIYGVNWSRPCARRYAADVKPVWRSKVVVNRLCVPKPVSTATSAKDCEDRPLGHLSVFRISDLAARRRSQVFEL